MNLLLYFAIGFAEWILAMVRTALFVRGRTLLVGWFVMFEILLGLYVVKIYVTEDNLNVAVAYSLGGGMGSIAGTWAKKFMKERADKDSPFPY